MVTDARGTNWPCQTPEDLPALAKDGIAAYNRQDFFLAHEYLELAWRAEKGAIRDLYRGILQAGLGFYHIPRGNYRGAVKMFLRSLVFLETFPEIVCGIFVGELVRDVHAALAEVRLLGEHGLPAFPAQLIRPLRLEL